MYFNFFFFFTELCARRVYSLFSEVPILVAFNVLIISSTLLTHNLLMMFFQLPFMQYVPVSFTTKLARSWVKFTNVKSQTFPPSKTTQELVLAVIWPKTVDIS